MRFGNKDIAYPKRLGKHLVFQEICWHLLKMSAMLIQSCTTTYLEMHLQCSKMPTLAFAIVDKKSRHDPVDEPPFE